MATALPQLQGGQNGRKRVEKKEKKAANFENVVW